MSVDEIRKKVILELEIKNNAYAKEIWNAAIEKVLTDVLKNEYHLDCNPIMDDVRKLKV